jgi:hypothetical protein
MPPGIGDVSQRKTGRRHCCTDKESSGPQYCTVLPDETKPRKLRLQDIQGLPGSCRDNNREEQCLQLSHHSQWLVKDLETIGPSISVPFTGGDCLTDLNVVSLAA